MTSTAVASTSFRPTQNLIVPTTQNTAPVLDFKCLYTYDLRRKQKRWQDGLLRFHTFNKRVMVYDVPRNYIGDTHWRDKGIVGDGDEFELDRGVLIQVGEATGSMEQDLTELLEKRKKPRDSVSGQTSSSPMGEPLTTATASPAVAQTSLLRPKSLNALLGTPKGPIGRASLPKKSPHEMRKAWDDVGCTDERPAKRPRLVDFSAIVPAPVIPQVRRSSPSRRKPTPLGGEQERNGRIHVSRHGENGFSMPGVTGPNPPGDHRMYPMAAPTADETISALKPRGDNGAKSARKQREHEEAKQRRKPGEALPRSNKAQSRPAIIVATGSPLNGLINWKGKAAEPVEITSDVEAVPSSEPTKKRMKLKIASRKPRRKLMYKDLLPQDSPAISCSLGSKHTAQGGRATSIPSGSERQSKQPLTEFHQKEQDQLADRLNGCPGNADDGNAGYENENPSKPASLSHFPTQEDSGNHSIERHRTSDNSANIRSIRYVEDGSEAHSNHTRSARSLKNQERSISKTSSTVHDTVLTLTKMDEILFSRPQSKLPLPRKTTETAAPVSLTRTCSPLPTPSTIAQRSPPPQPPQNVAPSTKSIPSSPASKKPPPAPTPKPQTPPLIPAFPSHATDLNATSPPRPLDPFSNIPPATTRPLKPPKSRSPLMEAASDKSSMRPPPPLMQIPSVDAEREEWPAGEHESSAWGKEAWDLFGCGRDGVECTYEEFKRKEGLV